MTDTVILVAGVQGSGKSWVCRQLTERFEYVPHDQCWKHPIAKPKDEIDAKWGPPGCVSTHLETLLKKAKTADKPIITEVPYAEKKLKEELEQHDLNVVTVFAVEDAGTLRKRYWDRERKHIPKEAITRSAGLADRADRWGSFAGTSAEVLEHLKHLSPRKRSPQYTLPRERRA